MAGASCSGRKCAWGVGTDVAGLRYPLRRARASTVTRALLADEHTVSAVRDLVQHMPLAFERVVYACSSQNCGDQIYRRCAATARTRIAIVVGSTS